jgi:hypothetical protein
MKITNRHFEEAQEELDRQMGRLTTALKLFEKLQAVESRLPDDEEREVFEHARLAAMNNLRIEAALYVDRTKELDELVAAAD